MEEVKIIFKIIIDRYDKKNSINVGITSNGKNVIYKTIKISEDEIDFMKQFLVVIFSVLLTSIYFGFLCSKLVSFTPKYSL